MPRPWLACVLLQLLLGVSGAIIACAQDRSSEIRESLAGLSSEDVGTRERAAKKLKDLGRLALPDLRSASDSRDPEVAMRAKAIARWIDIDLRLTPHFKKAIPKATDRLSAGEDHEWTLLFLEAARDPQARAQGIQASDLAPLAQQALSGATSDEERIALCKIVATVCVPGGEQTLLSYLKDANADLRARALTALSVLGSRDAIPEACRLLADSHGFVRVASLEALARLKAVEAIPQVGARLSDREALVRAKSVDALAALHATDWLPDIIRCLDDSNLLLAMSTRGAAALAALGGKELLPRIVAFLKSEDPKLRAGAVEALQVLKASEARPEFIQLAKDPDAAVRAAVASALGDIGSAQDIACLALLLKDPVARVRREAVSSMSQLGSANDADKIVDLLKDGDADVRCLAAMALERFGAKAAAPRMIDGLEDDVPKVRSATADALASLNVVEAADRIRKLLNDPVDVVRMASARALGKLHDKTSAPGLKKALNDEDRGVRVTSAESLCLLGEADGARALIKETEKVPPSLFVLNALRQPKVWSDLGEREASRAYRGARIALFEQFRGEAGFQFVVDDAVLKSCKDGEPVVIESTRNGRRLSQREILELLLTEGVECIVEQESVRLIPRAAAVRFWTSWLAEKAR